jgi:serine/threonine protein kinase
LFIAYDSIEVTLQACLVDGDCCPEFDRWLKLQRLNVRIDFRRIARVGSGLRCLRDCVVNLSGFEEGSMIDESERVGKAIYHRIEDDFSIFVKSISHSGSVKESRMDNEIENLINLRHPCIAGPIGFITGIESGNREELKIIRLYFEGCSLSEVISVRPVWWTSTVKAKVAAGIVLGLQFAHSHGLVHGGLTSRNILFDLDHCIEIVDFHPMRLQVGESESGSDERTKLGGFSGQKWTPQTDISGFASILFEIVVGRPANSDVSVPRNIRGFVSKIIETGLWSKTQSSFRAILDILKANNFEIEDGVDSAEVFAFIK